MSKQSIVEVSDLEIKYRFQVAIGGLNLRMENGQALGLLGPNGAGKTSTLRAILGMVRPARGRVMVFGSKPGTVSSFERIGFAPEEASPPEFLTGDEYLTFVGRLRVGDKKTVTTEVGRLMDAFELTPKKKIRDYSKGMRRKVILAQAFIGRPELLILDEPLNGLDPLFVIKLREYLGTYRQQGGSILYSSHILSEVEKTCSDIAVLSRGVLVLQDSMTNIVQKYGGVESAFSQVVQRS